MIKNDVLEKCLAFRAVRALLNFNKVLLIGDKICYHKVQKYTSSRGAAMQEIMMENRIGAPPATLFRMTRILLSAGEAAFNNGCSAVLAAFYALRQAVIMTVRCGDFYCLRMAVLYGIDQTKQ